MLRYRNQQNRARAGHSDRGSPLPADRYFSGKPCKRGHISERLASTKACIECANFLQRRWRDSHREVVRVNVRIQTKRWRDQNIEKERQRAANWRAREPEKAREATRKWRSQNLDKLAAKEHRRRARKAGVGGEHSSADVKEILKLQKGRCAYCREPISKKKRHVDHIIPLSRGGSNDKTNIQILCVPCNLSKGGRDPIDFARSRGGLL